MRKIVLFLTVALCAFVARAQESVKLDLVEVVPVEGVSADDLYDRAEMWVSQAFKNPDKVVKYKNKETHQLILNPQIPFQYSKLVGSAGVEGSIEYTVKINTREGRYRLEVTDCFHKASYSMGLLTSDTVLLEPKHRWGSLKWEQKVWLELLGAMKKEMAIISASLKAAMVIPDSSQSEDW
ncbi:DUF4468 domain-containing protein [uncultured Rikenella sp.]|uniref:DUF4468 domain-containing protein n=1 Tax=uncultured Rikenella sp. TaxID=368003 RepID=UPI002611752B|nr:DUF4468 domain-containing protein [uncultured Rikenella sp.]